MPDDLPATPELRDLAEKLAIGTTIMFVDEADGPSAAKGIESDGDGLILVEAMVTDPVISAGGASVVGSYVMATRQSAYVNLVNIVEVRPTD